MSFVKILLVTLMFVCHPLSAAKQPGYTYEVINQNKHTIHLVQINLKQYETQIVKAKDSTVGRETVLQMATRSDATVLSHVLTDSYLCRIFLKNKGIGIR